MYLKFSSLKELIPFKTREIINLVTININSRLTSLNFLSSLQMKKHKKIKLFSREKVHSLNIYIFLGFNLTLVSVLGFIWFNTSIIS